MFGSFTTEPRSNNHFQNSWSRRTTPLKNSGLFSKVKHSQEWYQSVKATAGVLRPSDLMFPYGFLRAHTDTYLRKKGKSSQAETDLRLAILIDMYESKDIAVAAIAHAMSVKCIRTLLQAETNVSHGSYWGLEIWLQCLIAAKHSNPASITDIEALWAQMLLPYATHGPCAAGSYLKGVSRALRKSPTRDFTVLTDFVLLIQRAVTDYATQLEGFRLKCQWDMAHSAAFWLSELDTTLSRAITPHNLQLESMFDSHFPHWRMWAHWRPVLNRIAIIAGIDRASASMLMDISILQGPDTITGLRDTLQDGLLVQYDGSTPWIQYRNLVLHVAEQSKECLAAILDRLWHGLEATVQAHTMFDGGKSILRLYREGVIDRPITNYAVEMFEAMLELPDSIDAEIHSVIQLLCTAKYDLGGQHISALQKLVVVLDQPSLQKLRVVLDPKRVAAAFQKCLEDCQDAIRANMLANVVWMPLALEFHTFCKGVANSTYVNALLAPTLLQNLQSMFSATQMLWLVEIYDAAQAYMRAHEKVQRSKNAMSRNTAVQTPADGNEKARHPLENRIEDFCRCHLLDFKLVTPNLSRTISAMTLVWERTVVPSTDLHIRSLAIIISDITAMDENLEEKCLRSIASDQKTEESTNHIKDLLSIVIIAKTDLAQGIINLTKLITSRRQERVECWTLLLHMWLLQAETACDMSMLDSSVQTMKAAEWLSFMHSLATIFIDNSTPITYEYPNPVLLQSQLFGWINQISRYTQTLTRLEIDSVDRRAIQLILTCRKGLWSKNVLRILATLERAEGKSVELLMHKITNRLSIEEENCWEIKECLIDVSQASLEAVAFCYKLWNAKDGFIDIPGLQDRQTGAESAQSRLRTTKSVIGPIPTTTTAARRSVPLAVAEVMLAGWIQDSSTQAQDRVAVESVAKLLKIELFRNDVPESKLTEASSFWQGIEAEVVAEAERLDALKKALKRADPKGTVALLQEISIPDCSPLEEEISALPIDIFNVVEIVGDNEVEASFSLSTHEMQRKAMGVPVAAQSLLLRIFVDHTGSFPPSFCSHFDCEVLEKTSNHSPWICSPESKPPQNDFCTSNQSIFLWQLNRRVHAYLQAKDAKMVDMYSSIKKQIETLSTACISCGRVHKAQNARLRRSTPCDMFACRHLWYQLPLEVRIPELRTDVFVVDIMLTSVYAAAMSGRPELLPACPFPSLDTVKAILNSLPHLTVLSHAVNVSIVLKAYHKDAEKLISWACVHFRGYLATATGICKVPNLPTGTHQFILANASPKLEGQFSSKVPKYDHRASTMVLFHGTPLDRLPAILAQGLKNCSGTSLQRIGAAHGKGIYLAEEPATSYSYSSTHLSWRNSGLSNMRLILGCEVVGVGRSVSPGIHVITDDQSVMVRYIFLFTSQATIPAASNIVPAMVSAIDALRSGVI
ncbi:hypothetical protein ACN47E_004781 [Coniothyrium glycines]